MKIYVNHVSEDGLDLAAEYDPIALEMNRADAQVAGPIRLEGRATLEAKELFVSAEVAYQLALTCARCLEPVTHRAAKSLFLHYDTTQESVVDITGDVRQEIMLEYPLIALCQPECRGLCTVCGANWNHGTCQHRGA